MLAWAPGTGAVGSGAHPFNLEVNGIDWIDRVQFASIRIEMPGPGSNGSMTFTLEDKDASVTVNEWDEIHFIEHAATRPILFGGFVQSVRYRAWASTGRSLQVTCVGYGILLDKKVVESFTVLGATAQLGSRVPPSIVNLINRWGGRVTGTANGDFIARNAYTTSTQHTITHTDDWVWMDAVYYGDNVFETNTLRGILDIWMSFSCDAALGDPFFFPHPIAPSSSAVYWVDSYVRLHAHPNLDEVLGGAANVNFDGTCPVEISETTGAGLVRAEAGSWDFERENTDLLTGAYVKGGNANGTGFVRRTGLDRAGDLEALVDQPASTSANLLLGYGDGAVGTTIAVDARVGVAIVSSTPLDIRPGQKMVVTSTPLGLSSQPFRIAGVSIEFISTAYRRYRLAMGGRLVKPSASRRSGRFKTTQRGT